MWIQVTYWSDLKYLRSLLRKIFLLIKSVRSKPQEQQQQLTCKENNKIKSSICYSLKRTPLAYCNKSHVFAGNVPVLLDENYFLQNRLQKS